MPVLNADWAKLQSYWEQVKDSGQFTEGYFVNKFEEMVSEFYGRHAIAFNSAGTALFSMVRCLNLRKGLAVVPNNTFFATGAMPREAGYAIVLADSSPKDFCMSADDVPWHMDPRIVVLTHVGGGIASDMVEMSHRCLKYGAHMLEDAAHAFGVITSEGRFPGELSTGAVFSVYPTKAIPVGEGGIAITSLPALAAKLREFRNYGKYKDSWGVLRYRRGFNFRMDEWTAAVACVQWERREEILAARSAIARRLAKVVPPMIDWHGESNWYKYIVHSSFPARRTVGKVYAHSDQLAAALSLPGGHLVNSQSIADSHICLPIDEGMYDGMTTKEMRRYLCDVD